MLLFNLPKVHQQSLEGETTKYCLNSIKFINNLHFVKNVGKLRDKTGVKLCLTPNKSAVGC